VSSTTLAMLILGRDGPDVADSGAALVSDVDVMKHIFAATTDNSCLGPATTIEPMTMQAARIATRPEGINQRRTSA
jgi:hypothetical protein